MGKESYPDIGKRVCVYIPSLGNNIKLLSPGDGKGFVFHIPMLGNHLSPGNGKGFNVYITILVYRIRETCAEYGKCWMV